MPSAAISVSSQGDNAIVVAQTAPSPGRKIKVRGYVLVAGGAVNVKWRSGTTDLTGAMPLVANSVLVVPFVGNSLDAGKWFQTDQGSALNLNLDANVQVSGHLEYDLE